jgi:hypothetical protein
MAGRRLAAAAAQVALPDDPGDSPSHRIRARLSPEAQASVCVSSAQDDLLGSLRYREPQWAAADETDTASRLALADR